MKESHNTTADFGLLALRLTTGGLMAGHGAQKLFGSFGGHGIQGTAGFLEKLGLVPGEQWAAMAGASEFGSGLLTALGLCSPIGPIATFGPMVMAWVTAHAGKPIWSQSGGAELPLMYMSNAMALALIGPGRYSMDKALGIKVPQALIALTAVGVAAGVAAGILTREQRAGQQEQATDARGEAQATRSMEENQPNLETSEQGQGEEQLKAREFGDDLAS